MPNRMDSMLAHGMGSAKKLGAAFKGLVGAFRTIAGQHGEVKVLLERANKSNEKFTELWPTIRRELLSHERAELNEIYPVLHGNLATRALAEHHDAEAAELEQLITRIDELAIGSAEQKAAYHQLVDRVLHHAEEEENKIFPAAQKALGKQTIEALDEPFQSAKRRLERVA